MALRRRRLPEGETSIATAQPRSLMARLTRVRYGSRREGMTTVPKTVPSLPPFVPKRA